ncbi:Polysialic acid transport ATP-binding protein KpsT [Pseudooceanicola marinus]|uniref:Polysialic acid transport ATP-binding protein KpsT n=1 Tax=Pseudooceanicola marinus TaxID=396013 RepID=A0A1X7A0G3_9RHOB|nr:ABC transporter ATP-binding protein [Pseudooceanicola marinus]PJE30188.1 ABC transporter ATP-binding protein [Pseudooceanicola marinus]SLN66555.1 Polysialic acid transport ATP-binding protein KpsT [Pseudooceanicola marinus]
MIRLQDLSKVYVRDGQRVLVADRICATFPARRSIALLGRNGAGKSTLLKMIAGTEDASSGSVITTGTVSWPVGFAGAFHPRLTGVQNVRFVARIHGVDSDALLQFVEDFAELGARIRLPYSSFSSGMRARMAFGLSMGLGFDTYLVDEITAVGDAAFRRRSADLFRERLTRAGAIVVSHSMPQLRELCDMGAVLEGGRLTIYGDLEEAIAHHQRNMAQAA